MNLEYRTGDLFDQKDMRAVAHGVNCAGAMGRGIAVEFKRRWPEMYSAYRAMCQSGELEVGDIFVWRTAEIAIYNLATQPDWKRSATLENIRVSVERMAENAYAHHIDRIGIPRIGAGLGGLSWDAVRSTLEQARGPGVTLVVVTPE